MFTVNIANVNVVQTLCFNNGSQIELVFDGLVATLSCNAPTPYVFLDPGQYITLTL